VRLTQSELTWGHAQVLALGNMLLLLPVALLAAVASPRALLPVHPWGCNCDYHIDQRSRR
jgi:hypothetical protein